MFPSRGLVVLACVVSFAGAPRASGHGELECVDFRALGTFQTSELVTGGVRVTATENFGLPGTVNVRSLNGLGVVGAPSDTTVDTSEGLRIDFDGFLASDVWYRTGVQYNGDGDGIAGETYLTGYGPLGARLGSLRINPTLLLHVNSLFGGSPLSGFKVEAVDDDRFAVAQVCYVRAPAVTCVDFGKLGTFQVAEFTVEGMRITATENFGFPGIVRVTASNGLGVVGAVSDLTVDTSEAIRIEFDGFVADDVWFFAGLRVNGDGDAYVGEMYITAYGPGGKLGSQPLVPEFLVHVNSLFGGSPLTGFEIAAADEDRLTIEHVCYVAPGGGCAGDLDADGDTDVFDFGILASDWECQP